MSKKETSRKSAIEIVKRQMLQSSFPRLQFSVIMLLTALTGFLTSFFLLQLGVYSMAFRYPFAIIIAYCAFLILLRIWLWLQTDNDEDFSIDLSDVDLGDISLPVPDSLSSSSTSSLADVDFNFGGGGDFAGGGAGGSWSEGDVKSSPAKFGFLGASSVGDSSGGKSSSFLDDLDLGEDAGILLIIIAIVAVIVAAGYVIYIAPVLLAEIFVDGVLVTGLYHRVKKIDQRYWLKTAVKKTLLPAFIIAICLGIAGYLMQEMVPEARSIGEFWKRM